MDTQMREGLEKLMAATGVQLVQSFSSRFDPNAMVQEAKEQVGLELRAAFMEILGDVDSDTTQDLLDKLFERIDDFDVIEAIKVPLAESMATWLKDNMDDLITAIIDQMDLDSLTELVAEKVAAKIQIAG